jgi:uncharacterized protein with FMN-binding domain
MKRTPIVVGATVAGLAGVLAFHTTPSKLDLPALPKADGSQAASPPRPSATSGHRVAAGKPARRSSGTSGTSGTSGGRRSAAGPGVSYGYGTVSVKVTVSGSKILNVGIASIDDGGNPRSESIDQQAIPILEQEVLQAQSANIQAVSGASYTSAGFTQSLQSALQGLGFQ